MAEAARSRTQPKIAPRPCPLLAAAIEHVAKEPIHTPWVSSWMVAAPILEPTRAEVAGAQGATDWQLSIRYAMHRFGPVPAKYADGIAAGVADHDRVARDVVSAGRAALLWNERLAAACAAAEYRKLGAVQLASGVVTSGISPELRAHVDEIRAPLATLIEVLARPYDGDVRGDRKASGPLGASATWGHPFEDLVMFLADDAGMTHARIAATILESVAWPDPPLTEDDVADYTESADKVGAGIRLRSLIAKYIGTARKRHGRPILMDRTKRPTKSKRPALAGE